MRRPALFILVLTALAAWPITASGHEKRSSSATAMFSSFLGEGSPFATFNAAGLAEPNPLEGTGQNMRIVANVPLAGTVAGSDIELAGDYAYVGSYGEGMVIIDIKDPRNPKRAGVFPCGNGSQFDIQLQPGSNPQYAVMAHESASTTKKCHPGDEGFSVIDISNKANPTEVAFIGQAVKDGGVQDGAHNTTMDWPYLYVDQYLPSHGEQEGRTGQVDIFDLRRVIAGDKKPLKVLPAAGGGFHDMQVDHRPDGKVIGYGASIGFTDELDLSKPEEARFLRRFAAVEHGVGISHGLEPNHDRTLAIESDEYGGGSGVGGCGGGDAEGPLPTGVGPTTVPNAGALHFLKLNPDGTFKATGPKIEEAGLFNITPQTNPSTDEGCTAHVFWQAPDENRLVVAWYGRGTRIVDFTNPANPKELGFFIPKNTETWSAKPHKGYIFTGDTVRGMDVLEYTGEDCARWPRTSGAAEVQRDRYQGSAFKVGGMTPTTAVKSTPAGCGGKPQEGGTTQCTDGDPSPTLPDGGGTGGSTCQPSSGPSPTPTPAPQSSPTPAPTSTPSGQPTACASNAGFASATARGRGASGALKFEFSRRVDEPVTVDIFQQSRGRKITGERRVRRFTNKTASFTWNGRDSRGRKVPNGVYFARLRIDAPNGQADTVRIALGRSKGRFGPRRAFYGRDRCGTLARYKLSRPVFGGSASQSLGIAYRLNRPARVQVTVTNRFRRVVKRFAARDVAAGTTQRLSLSARKLARGEYRVKISVTRNGSTTTSTLTSTRL